jgi:uncharacterized pyridoxamine 5'-phosphate oxidase family protein
MNHIVEAIKKNGVFYVATIGNDNQPEVRPFSSVTEINGALYICTNNTKNVYKQLMKNPRIALSSMGKDGTWLRVTGTAVRDDNDASRKAMLEDPTGPSSLYTLGDGIFEVFRIENAHAVQYSMTSAPVEIKA